METVSFDSFSSWAVDWLEWTQHLYPGQQMLPDTTADYQHQLIATKYEKHNLFLERQSTKLGHDIGIIFLSFEIFIKILMHNFGSLICGGFLWASFNAVKQENWIIFHQKTIRQIQQFQCKFFKIKFLFIKICRRNQSGSGEIDHGYSLMVSFYQQKTKLGRWVLFEEYTVNIITEYFIVW